MGTALQGVVITGLGPVSSFGIGITDFAAAARAITTEPASMSATVRLDEFDVYRHFPLKTQCLDRTSGMAVVASHLARGDAGWDARIGDLTRTGLVLGTACGNMTAMAGYRALTTPSPLRFVHTLINTPGGLTSQALKLRGVHAVLCSGPLAGLQAVRYAHHLLAHRKADRILCGGTEGLRIARHASERSGPASKIASAEGAGVIALQRETDIDASVYARVAGIGIGLESNGAPGFLRDAMRDAMTACGIASKDLDAVVLATAQTAKHAEAERAALEEFAIRKDRWVEFAGCTGDVGAAYGGLSVILACTLLREEPGWRYVAVNGVDDKQCMTMVLKNKGVA